MKLASAADAGVIAGTLPAASAGVAMLVLGERPTPALMGAIVLATLGVLVCTARLDDFTAPRVVAGAGERGATCRRCVRAGGGAAGHFRPDAHGA
jgi:hypothetical protein